MVSRWSISLLQSTSHLLLDHQAPEEIRQKVMDGIQKKDDNHVVDLHLWAVGPAIYAAIVSVTTKNPKAPEYYKKLLPADLELVHVTVEVHRR